ncbi:MAG: long-chain fatty acid--CoA ligase [Chloroflexota bacterium]|nr:MAG: long-chain fatty acid--CoA ligase [Chloroflexota bacterium]
MIVVDRSQANTETATELDTLPKILRAQFRKYGDKKVAMRKKQYGIWNEQSWADIYERVRNVALGLVSLGWQRGDHVAIVGDNDPEWYCAEYATHAIGGAVTGLFVDAHFSEVEYLIGHSEARYVFAKDQEQVDKVLEVRAQLPRMERIIYWDDRGLWTYDDPLLMSYGDLEERGRKLADERPMLFEQQVDLGKASELAALCYTSGTTGSRPKGVMLSHKFLIGNAEDWFKIDPWPDTDDYLAYTPPAWGMEQVQGVAGALIAGVTLNFPEKPETLQNDIREIEPQYLFFSARVWDTYASTVQSKITESTALKRWLYNLFLPVGNRMAGARFCGKSPGLLWQALWTLGNMLVFRPLRDKHGFIRVRTAYQAGASMSSDCFRFFHIMGINVKQMYGLTESGIVTIHRNCDIDPESVGRPLEEGSIRISERGEIMVRDERLCDGYFRNEEATRELFDADGWMHTGDGGYITEHGHLIYLDRVKDLVPLPGGGWFAPQFIESKLGFSPYIRYAMAIGGENKPFVSAVICIDFQNVGNWAQARRVNYTTYVDLSQKSEVYALIEKDIQRVNKYLPEGARIRRFVNFHKEFDADEAELTRTRKLRRKVAEEHYKGLIDAIYAGKEQYIVQADVKYRDGRSGVISTGIRIRPVCE